MAERSIPPICSRGAIAHSSRDTRFARANSTPRSSGVCIAPSETPSSANLASGGTQEAGGWTSPQPFSEAGEALSVGEECSFYDEAADGELYYLLAFEPLVSFFHCWGVIAGPRLDQAAEFGLGMHLCMPHLHLSIAPVEHLPPTLRLQLAALAARVGDVSRARTLLATAGAATRSPLPFSVPPTSMILSLHCS